MLKVKDLSLNLSGFALQNISFSLGKGGYLVVLGKSGSGKSLLLECIAGLKKPDAGQVFLDDTEIQNQSIQKRNIGLLFQDYALFPHLTVFDNIAYSLHGQSKSEAKKIVGQWAAETEIQHLLGRFPNHLSGGEKQRVALARILAMKPKLLLLDEPLSALDSDLLADSIRLLKKINETGQTIIHVTHNQMEVEQLAKQIARMENGKLKMMKTHK